MGKVKEEVRVRVAVVPVEGKTWDVQIGGLLDLKSLKLMQCNAVEMGSVVGKEKIEEMPVDINSNCPSNVS